MFASTHFTAIAEYAKINAYLGWRRINKWAGGKSGMANRHGARKAYGGLVSDLARFGK